MSPSRNVFSNPRVKRLTFTPPGASGTLVEVAVVEDQSVAGHGTGVLGDFHPSHTSAAAWTGDRHHVRNLELRRVPARISIRDLLRRSSSPPGTCRWPARPASGAPPSWPDSSLTPVIGKVLVAQVSGSLCTATRRPVLLQNRKEGVTGPGLVVRLAEDEGTDDRGLTGGTSEEVANHIGAADCGPAAAPNVPAKSAGDGSMDSSDGAALRRGLFGRCSSGSPLARLGFFAR